MVCHVCWNWICPKIWPGCRKRLRKLRDFVNGTNFGSLIHWYSCISFKLYQSFSLMINMGEKLEKEKGWAKFWNFVNGDNFDGLIYWRWSLPPGVRTLYLSQTLSLKEIPGFNLFLKVKNHRHRFQNVRFKCFCYLSFQIVYPHVHLFGEKYQLDERFLLEFFSSPLIDSWNCVFNAITFHADAL